MFRKRMALPRPATPNLQSIATRPDTMKSASHSPSEYHPVILGGPTAAVLVALAGAALVVMGLVLVGTRGETKVGQWAPGLVDFTLEANS